MKKILVIEDNQEVRENLEEILQLSGYNTEGAENGKEGVQKALETLPDLILCDIMMPELDGYGVLNILSKKPATSDIPFIFLSAKSEREDLRRGMNLGADDYITKPFYKDELLTVVETRLAKSDRLRKISLQGEVSLGGFFNEARAYEELDKLSHDREQRTYEKRAQVYQESKSPRYVYHVESGQIKVFKTNADGREFILDILGPGSFFGYIDVITGGPATDSAVALESSVLTLIPKEDFLRLVFGNKDVSARFIKMLANQTAEKEEQILQLAYRNVRKRVAEVLLKLQPAAESGINMFRDDLAALAGTAKETVIRMISEFKDDGYIDVRNGVIYVMKPEKLAALPG